ncbi:hypothetical protein HDV05_003530 [Chytridiales sp. JEL 0842]|nr:hypothetical protein HDV05_003530 [Chytridiales sp. JEL 0842]
MSTGDLHNNISKVQADVKSLHYNGQLDIYGLSKGDPAALLPLIHFILLDSSPMLAKHFASRKYELYGKRDTRFMESVHKLLRDEFGYKPSLNRDQFFSMGFAERKLIFISDLVRLCKQLRDNLSRNSAFVQPHCGSGGSVDAKKGFKVHRRQKTVTGGVLVANNSGNGLPGDNSAPVQLEIPTTGLNKLSFHDSRSGNSPRRSHQDKNVSLKHTVDAEASNIDHQALYYSAQNDEPTNGTNYQALYNSEFQTSRLYGTKALDVPEIAQRIPHNVDAESILNHPPSRFMAASVWSQHVGASQFDQNFAVHKAPLSYPKKRDVTAAEQNHPKYPHFTVDKELEAIYGNGSNMNTAHPHQSKDVTDSSILHEPTLNSPPLPQPHPHSEFGMSSPPQRSILKPQGEQVQQQPMQTPNSPDKRFRFEDSSHRDHTHIAVDNAFSRNDAIRENRRENGLYMTRLEEVKRRWDPRKSDNHAYAYPNIVSSNENEYYNMQLPKACNSTEMSVQDLIKSVNCINETQSAIKQEILIITQRFEMMEATIASYIKDLTHRVEVLEGKDNRNNYEIRPSTFVPQTKSVSAIRAWEQSEAASRPYSNDVSQNWLSTREDIHQPDSFSIEIRGSPNMNAIPPGLVNADISAIGKDVHGRHENEDDLSVHNEMHVAQKVCLIVIDGWGIAPADEAKGDAIRNANTPCMTSMAKEYAYTELEAHGLSVGLPEGLMGNSEVGHLNIGAGRVVYQDIVRIDLSLKNKTLAAQPALAEAFARAASPSGTGRLHLMGLVSDGGVHSHQNHLHAMLDAAKAAKVPNTFIHFFGDGRDTSPKSSTTYLARLGEHVKQIGYGTLATIVGRYYAMDRDKRWERIKVAFDALVDGVAEHKVTSFEGFTKAVEAAYERGETDEFLKPIVLDNAEGAIKDGDTIVCFNYRSDRMREISAALGIQPTPFEARRTITTMTQYKADYPFSVIFPPQKMDNVLGEWLGRHQVPQCHVAETEKYAHVTFFFNGGTEAQYALEERELIASPKVATYDLKPEMSAIEVGEKVAERISTKKFPFVMCNFAPPDMVGHTGIYEAARKGVEATDKAISIIKKACDDNGYILFVTADHGNAEKMLAADGTPHTAHTCNKVPFVMTSKTYKFDTTKVGILADCAPTILDVMGLPIPGEMTGQSLLKK